MGYLSGLAWGKMTKFPASDGDPPPTSLPIELSPPTQSALEATFAEFAPDRVERLVQALVFGMRLRCLSAEQVWLHTTLLLPAGQPEADQPHRFSGPGFRLEQVPCHLEDDSVACGSHREGARTGMGLEWAKANLQRDDGPREPLVTGQKTDLLRRPAQGVAQHRRIDNVFPKGGLLRDRLAFAGGVNLIAGDPAGLEMDLCARPRPEVPAELFEGKAANVADRSQAEALELRWSLKTIATLPSTASSTCPSGTERSCSR
jgi:hypothetical protein